jgi:hypothetical protein
MMKNHRNTHKQQHESNRNDVCSDDGTASSSVSFGEVSVRTYPMTLGVNPSCSLGAPVCLDWDYDEQPPVSVDEFESSKSETGENGRRRKRTDLKQLYLSYYKRKDIVESAGFATEDFNACERTVQKDRLCRKLSVYENYPLIAGRRIRTSVARIQNKVFVLRYKRQAKREAAKTLQIEQQVESQQQQ